jgi:gliding motility-associated-like protein
MILNLRQFVFLLSHNCVAKSMIVFLIVGFSIGETRAQLVVQGGLTPLQLAQIIAGPGITVSNATVTGSAQAYGSFNGAGSNIGLPSGVILTTGPIGVAVGPNNMTSAGSDIFVSGNSMLNGLAGAQTFDAIVLEFDFVPLSNTVVFNYVFGSEEYPEFVNSGYNDAFAFFISGPGIAATYGTANYNMARVPGTAQPVTIDNVNAGSNNQYYFNNGGGATIQYDAFTRPLIATADVQACQTYHIEMTIADAGDGIYDSGVFIEENSLISNAIQIEASTASVDSTAYEGCSSATVTFTLGSAVSTPTVINYNVLGTATNGTDFTQIPTSVTIPANQLTTSFQITPIQDGTTEGIETIIIDVQTSVCGTDAIIVYLNDLVPLTVQAFGDTAFCPGGTAMLWAESQGGGGGVTYTWSTGATTDTIYVSPAVSSNYTVSATDYCSSANPTSNSVTVTIDAVPVANAGPNQVYCTGDVVTLSTGGADSYVWYQLPAMTQVSIEPTVVLNPSGNIDYMVVAWIGSCSDTDQVSITELPADPIDAIGDTAVCQGTGVQLNVVGATASSTYSWSPSLGLSNAGIVNPIATPSASEWFVVTVMSPNGCIGVDSVLVTIYNVPVPSFTMADVCLNEASTFTNTSTVAGSVISSTSWNFGDASATVATPIANHTYATDGSYEVVLTVTSAQGCVDSISQTTVIYPLPIADFTAQSDCADRMIAFNENASVSSGAIVSWNWDFGNTQTSILQIPVGISYPVSATYNVQLEVATAFGCLHDTTIAIDIYPNPTAAFTVQDVCLLLDNAFTNASISAGNYPIVAYDWTFENGQTSSLQDPTSTFVAPGQYFATLLVTDSLGCQDEVTLNTVVVHPLPVVDFSAPISCLGDATVFTNNSTILSGTLTGYAWNFGDGNSSNSASSFNTYASDSTYSVQLIATSDQGCVDSATQNISIGPIPVADFQFSDDCLDKLIGFTDNSTVASGSIIGWGWDFGNSTTSTVQNPTPQQYLTDGIFQVQLVVISDLGCTHDTTMNIEIYPMPIVSFSWDSVCFGIPNQFTDLSLANGAYPIDTYAWQFSDGQTSTIANPQVIFPSAGQYSATLSVTTTMGCLSSATNGNAAIYPIPVAQFSNAIKNCLNDSTYFQDLSTVQNLFNDVVVTQAWDFADGTLSSQENPVHMYATDGFFPVQLSVITDKGCVDTLIQNVEIFPLPAVAFTSDVQEGCQPLEVQFIDQTIIAPPYSLAQWQWNFDIGTDSATAQFPINTFYDENIAPLDSGLYDISLQVTSGNGCVASLASNNFIVTHPKPTAFFDANPNLVDMNNPRIQFTDLSSINVNYWDWDFGDGNSTNITNPQHIYGDTGTYPVVLLVSTPFGCLDTAVYEVVVKPTFTFYIPNTFTPNNEGHNETFYGQGTGISAYSMMIFDRWGEMIFESNDIDYHWDGSVDGHQVQQGVYVYVFAVTDWDGEIHHFNGHVNLMR